MRVNPQDGRCRNCNGRLEIIEADDATMTVMCVDCGDNYVVEPDAFDDGAIEYWPAFIAEQEDES